MEKTMENDMETGSVYIYIYIHMSVRRTSLYNSIPWTLWGGSYRFWGFGHRIQGKVSLLGVSAKTQSWLRLRLMGIAFGGVLSLLGLLVRFLHLTAFLLFVLNTRVLTIAHMLGFRVWAFGV